MAYPTPQMEKVTEGRQTRLATTDDFMQMAEAASGMKLGWFFEVYLRQPKLPKLITETSGNQMTLRWEVHSNLPFPMPVEVQTGSSIKRYEMLQGSAIVPIEPGQQVRVDPHNWILKVQ